RLLSDQFPNWSFIQPSTSTLILDSCPGIGNAQHARRAMGSLVRNTLLKRLMDIIITWLFFYSAIMRRLFRQKNPLEVLKTALNSPRLLPWIHKGTPRLYLYSKQDEIVPSHEVEGHFNDAKAAGLLVRAEVFDDTPHVSHARINPERYWGAVEDIWRDACEGYKMDGSY
ncbi:hypothetical protein H0H81_003194, partial [Sphagnurus paluster]